MSEPLTKTTVVPCEVELAAGGLVWRYDDDGMRLAVVHRSGHGDWVLPKGRLDQNEDLPAAALREAMEETREKARLERFAGTYSYLKGSQPKVVVIWHMANEGTAYQKPAPSSEVKEIVWLSPEAAIGRLTHETERRFVNQHCDRQGFRAEKRRASDPRLRRLRGEINSCVWKLQAKIAQCEENCNSWWSASASKALETARNNLLCKDAQGGWVALHEAERFLVYGMTDAELLGNAVKVKYEAQQKLGGWRRKSVDALVTSLDIAERETAPMKPEDRALLQRATVECLELLNENSDNVYHRMDLVEQQLNYLVAVCGLLLIGSFIASVAWAPDDSKLQVGYLVTIAIAGGLGGIVSAMYQLSRIGEAKIPEALLHGLITTGRPLVGAASALFLYTVVESGLISIIDPSKLNDFSALCFAFVAGFSERFVLKIVGRVTGGEKEETGKKMKLDSKKKDALTRGRDAAVSPGTTSTDGN